MESGARLSWCIMGTVLGTVCKGTRDDIPTVPLLTSRVVMQEQWPQGGIVKECWVMRVETSYMVGNDGSRYNSLSKLPGSVEGNHPAFLSLNQQPKGSLRNVLVYLHL